jgi:hypothetical protein
MTQSTAERGQRFEQFGRTVDERLSGAGPRIEEEVRRVIAYLNDEVVPEVRRSSSVALRSAAQRLSQLAERLDRNTAPPGAASAGPGER